MTYRHEALIYLTCITWEKSNCLNLYDEMMIEVHQSKLLEEEGKHLISQSNNN